MIDPQTGKRRPQVSNDRICRFNVREIDILKHFRVIVSRRTATNSPPPITTVNEVLK